MPAYHENRMQEYPVAFLSRFHPRRNTVLTVLLAWLFSLSVGWANACLLQDRGTHAHEGSVGTASAVSPLVISAGHAGAVATHDSTPAFPLAPCMKVCGEGSHGMVKAPTALDLTDTGQALPVAIAWTANMAMHPAVGAAHESSPPLSGPPLRIRYARLAL